MFHTVIVAGNIGRDPEMRYTPSGVPVTSFSVATSRQYSNAQGQPVKETIWFRITCWSKLAEFANTYLKKGTKIIRCQKVQEQCAESESSLRDGIRGAAGSFLPAQRSVQHGVQ